MKQWKEMNKWQKYWHKHVWELVSHEPIFIAISDKAPSLNYVRNIPCEGYFRYQCKCKCGCERFATPEEYSETMNAYDYSPDRTPFY